MHREIIGCFCIASNVSGIITPYEEISKLIKRYGGKVLFDAAASSPYINVPSWQLYDVLVLSPHKLLGGPGSCGLLIIRKRFNRYINSPTFAGGGTVEYVNKDFTTLSKDIEIREDAGTPPILQFIRASLAYQLRNEIGFDFIKNRKNELKEYFISELKKYTKLWNLWKSRSWKYRNSLF